MDRSRLIRFASELPQGHPERRRILAGLKDPEIRIRGRQVSVNQAFVDALLRKFRAFILKDTPRGGYTYIHPESDTDSSFKGGSEYDFFFHPKLDEPGWYSVGYTPGYLILLQKDADKLKAHTTRMASKRLQPGKHVSKDVGRELTRFVSEAESLWSWSKNFHKVLQKEFHRLEDHVEAVKKEWVAKGNHPDDFNDPRLNPEGVELEKAREWAEMMSKAFDPKASNTVTRRLELALEFLQG